MCATHNQDKKSLVASVLSNKCPRCRTGNLFTNPHPYNLSTTMRMPEKCPVCGQRYELETGFYFGTGYVSYALSVLFTFIFFVGYGLTLGLSFYDNSIFWCLGANAFLLLILQPVIQRLSRSIWISFFVRYDKDWMKHKPQAPNHEFGRFGMADAG